MNKILMIFRVAVLVAVVGCLQSCLDNFEDYNRNQSEATDKELEGDNYLVGAKITKLESMVIPTEEHLYQFAELLAGQSYGGYAEATVDSWETKFSTFNPTADWLKAPFVDVITQTYPSYRGIINKSDNEVALALADILRVAIMHRLTDAYGPIPYSKIVEDKKERLTVPYDSQQAVYEQMFKELDLALESLERNRELSTEAFGEYDLVYGGDLKKWIKYTNSLKLRMAMRLAYIDEGTAKTLALEAINGGLIETNDDNARLQTELNHMTLPWNSWKDHAVGADILCYMRGYKDPRMPKMFTQGTVGEGEAAVKGYYGLRIGTTPSNKDKAVAACSRMAIEQTDPILWFTAAETAFLRAEYEFRFGSAASAQTYYEQGITLSFEQWGAGDPTEYIADEANIPEAYTDPLGVTENNTALPQSRITIKWDEEADFETNLERIITQKWIAIYPLGNEAWAEYRRTGYPKLMPVVDNKSGGTVNSKYGMRRLPYPSEEYSENRTNVQAAVSMLGGPDEGGTRVWWDCKPLN
ncbi:RagB/SusD family nutrient uptake outer membrane protein [Alistipes sp.]|uniref:RagB/SusD family nutrient uptake outer membrane protein n=1 Tax=Alistipes sp. TaxID=1872444 RepID=UPI003AF11701